jgi:hypothetical protein
MHCPDALDLAEAASGQFRSLFDGPAGGAVSNDALIVKEWPIGDTPCGASVPLAEGTDVLNAAY